MIASRAAHQPVAHGDRGGNADFQQAVAPRHLPAPVMKLLGEYVASRCPAACPRSSGTPPGDPARSPSCPSVGSGLPQWEAHTAVFVFLFTPSVPRDAHVTKTARQLLDMAFRGTYAPELVAWRWPEAVLITSNVGAASEPAARLLVEHLALLLRSAGAGIGVRAGASVATRRGVGQAIREARVAAALAQQVRGTGFISTLGEYRAVAAMVAAVRHGPSAEAFRDVHERYLGPLIAHDRRANVSFIDTIEALFNQNGNASATARRLGISRQSLLARLSRVESLARVNLANSADRFALELALRSWALGEAGALPKRPCDARPADVRPHPGRRRPPRPNPTSHTRVGFDPTSGRAPKT